MTDLLAKRFFVLLNLNQKHDKKRLDTRGNKSYLS